MATAYTTPIYQRRNEVGSMSTETTNNQLLRPELEKIVDELIGLKNLTKSTGYMTFKSQKAILDRLPPADQAVVGRELKKREETK
jgi:hypothetical protein